MTDTLRVVPPPLTLARLLTGLRRVVGDVAYGIHAGNAIRHGVPAPHRAGIDAPHPRVPRPGR